MDDNDETLKFYDIQGESLYTNPPSNNNPVIDHGCDEDEVWAWRLSGYNQWAVINQYTRQSFWTSRHSHAPFWGKKMIAPAFFKEDKIPKYLEQWNVRLGLEEIKMRHALELATAKNTTDPKLLAAHKKELGHYIGSALAHEKARRMNDIHITDHAPPQKKYNTTNA